MSREVSTSQARDLPCDLEGAVWEFDQETTVHGHISTTLVVACCLEVKRV